MISINRKGSKFSAELESLVRVTAALQIRVLEIKEFERQWKNLFNDLIIEFGPDVNVNVANQMLLHTFRYDKFHIVCDDLLSLVENEYKGEFSVSRQASSHLCVKSLVDFIENEKTNDYEILDVESSASATKGNQPKADREMFDRIFATEKRNARLFSYQELFGTSDDDKERREFLKKILHELAEKIRGLRHLFSHKHVSMIQKKYSAKWNDLEIEKIEEWFKNFFSIVQKMLMLSEGTHYSGTIARFDSQVSDQIDLILFGTIDNCSQLFTNKFPGMPYWQARAEFYKSRDFVDVVVSKSSRGITT